ncbi:hypothetical protein [Undibacterium oligocarboniphilum]|uniref:Uncharacterized protein n=1 Tax=Undibacterium oligocarboniphilum TaxID=666702 RepID=A0A850QML7_9BURK|nr:hypothetical protein [Undibacterium oligocarboniphilum]MBC3869733.1 hypothetical protein [Undibacterium oligocarboniphilum]NVO77336.1 hypothetical protein [Undibacterium oligocarboniphilum]
MSTPSAAISLRDTTHPHTLTLAGGDLVANAFAGVGSPLFRHYAFAIYLLGAQLIAQLCFNFEATRFVVKWAKLANAVILLPGICVING